VRELPGIGSCQPVLAVTGDIHTLEDTTLKIAQHLLFPVASIFTLVMGLIAA
jgi:hypothetical protein